MKIEYNIPTKPRLYMSVEKMYAELQQYIKLQNCKIKNLQVNKLVDVVLGLFAPARYNIQYYRGYDISKLGDKYRAMKVLKDRHYGCANRYVHLKFNGATNYFSELPKPSEIDYNQI